MALFPAKDAYRVGEWFGLNCNESGLLPMPRGTYRCNNKLAWEPPVPADLRCTNEDPFVPDGQCGPGQTLQGSRCVCVQRESCLSHALSLCVLNVNVDVAVSTSLCSFHAGRCHGDPLLFIHGGPCDPADSSKLEWARFRAKMGSKSSEQTPCNLDTCYEWETCSASKSCQCKSIPECPRTGAHMFCVKLSTQRTRSMTLCAVAALRCGNHQFEILNEGVCESR